MNKMGTVIEILSKEATKNEYKYFKKIQSNQRGEKNDAVEDNS